MSPVSTTVPLAPATAGLGMLMMMPLAPATAGLGNLKRDKQKRVQTTKLLRAEMAKE